MMVTINSTFSIIRSTILQVAGGKVRFISIFRNPSFESGMKDFMRKKTNN